jgi:hypothetical protein
MPNGDWEKANGRSWPYGGPRASMAGRLPIEVQLQSTVAHARADRGRRLISRARVSCACELLRRSPGDGTVVNLERTVREF